jgi:DNA replication protein DnaC
MAPGRRGAGNLPTELSSPAGRRDGLAEVRRLLAGSYLVTLTGDWLTDFDFDANPAVNAAVINILASCNWVRKGQPLRLIGDSGTGDSRMLIVVGNPAAMAGFGVRDSLASRLANDLLEAADDKQFTRTIARSGRVDLLCPDETGDLKKGAATVGTQRQHGLRCRTVLE